MKKKQKKILNIVILCAIVAAGVMAYLLFSPVARTGESAYLYIDNDDDMDSVEVKLSEVASDGGVMTVKFLADCMGYNVRSGRYAVESDMGSLKLFRHLRNGQQDPLMLTVPSVRTKDRLAHEISEKLMLNADSLLDAISDPAVCEKYGLDTANIVCMFIPNSYEIYWNISLDKFLDRMKTESENFWQGERLAKAQKLDMTPEQVITLASIVDEETANNPEKPMIAGMYYNRLKKGMPLQADPTIKFALQDFELRRIYTKLLSVISPYNTYRNIGLPPGPIRIPSVAGIDAVLNLVHHDYLYMCAKEDFSGTHNFARTYPEHLLNAAKYSKALDARNIK